MADLLPAPTQEATDLAPPPTRAFVPAYLRRIAYAGPVAATAATLRALHLAHLRAVPFENMDIPRGRPIRLDEAALFAKIVERRRGGFCFELNGLFAALLDRLGFRVARFAAQFPRPPGVIAPEFDHLTLLVHTRDDDTPWLADVGAGRGSFVLPLRADTAAAQPQAEAGASFRLAAEGAHQRLFRREPGRAWEPSYAFTPAPRRLADFEAGSRYHQTSPDSPFTQNRVCSLLTPTGRVTVADGRLIVTDGGARRERDLSPAEETAALRDLIGIVLEG